MENSTRTQMEDSTPLLKNEKSKNGAATEPGQGPENSNLDDIDAIPIVLNMTAALAPTGQGTSGDMDLEDGEQNGHDVKEIVQLPPPPPPPPVVINPHSSRLLLFKLVDENPFQEGGVQPGCGRNPRLTEKGLAIAQRLVLENGGVYQISESIEIVLREPFTALKVICTENRLRLEEPICESTTLTPFKDAARHLITGNVESLDKAFQKLVYLGKNRITELLEKSRSEIELIQLLPRSQENDAEITRLEDLVNSITTGLSKHDGFHHGPHCDMPMGVDYHVKLIPMISFGSNEGSHCWTILVNTGEVGQHVATLFFPSKCNWVANALVLGTAEVQFVMMKNGVLVQVGNPILFLHDAAAPKPDDLRIAAQAKFIGYANLKKGVIQEGVAAAVENSRDSQFCQEAQAKALLTLSQTIGRFPSTRSTASVTGPQNWRLSHMHFGDTRAFGYPQMIDREGSASAGILAIGGMSVPVDNVYRRLKSSSAVVDLAHTSERVSERGWRVSERGWRESHISRLQFLVLRRSTDANAETYLVNISTLNRMFPRAKTVNSDPESFLELGEALGTAAHVQIPKFENEQQAVNFYLESRDDTMDALNFSRLPLYDGATFKVGITLIRFVIKK